MAGRQSIVDNANWGVDNKGQIHYTQDERRMDFVMAPQHLPLWTDCSAFYTLCCAWAGVPDPNGLDYNGSGFTGTIRSYLPQIDMADALPGDPIIYGRGSGEHMVCIVELDGDDPWVVSHGQESGPFRIRHSVEVRAHAGPFTVHRVLGEEDMANSDEILGKVNEAVLYAADADTKATHTERMLGSLIQALKDKGVIDEKSSATG